ncbi:MAG: transposase [Rubrobacter sp.]|nr:transposase [Rubrobacter sp.]
MFRRPTATQETVAVQVHETLVELGARLREFSSLRQFVEALLDGRKCPSSCCEHLGFCGVSEVFQSCFGTTDSPTTAFQQPRWVLEHAGDSHLFTHLSAVRELIQSKGCKLLYLPPYSPDLNPIEEAFAKVKALLRRSGARAREALMEAIGRALGAVTAQDARSFFEHCGYCLPG